MTYFKRIMFLAGAAAFLLHADTLTMRDGQTFRGTFLGGTAREVRMDLNGDIRTFELGRVQSITFSSAEQEYPQSQQRPSTYPSENPRPRMTAAPVSGGLMIPADTEIVVRMIDSVDSERARLGESFRASLDEPVVVNGQEVIPRGADVLTKLVQDQRSGKIQGRTILTLAVQTITVNGQPVDVTTSDVQTASSSRGKRSAGVVGGGAALGAVIGAIAGGGKGAAIGAGAGAAAGAGAEVLTGGQKVRIPSETRLTFRLQNPVRL